MTKKIFFLFIAVLLNARFGFSQVIPTIGWVNYFSDDPTLVSVSTALDANSKVYVTGEIQLLTKDIVVQCTDSTGAIQWTYYYDNGSIDTPKKIKVDAFGKVYVTGVSTSTTGVKLDYVTFALSSTGSLLWVNRFDGSSDDDVPADITFDNFGDVYVTGKSKNGSGDWDAVTIKLDGTSGLQMWQHTNTGSGLDDEAVCMTLNGANTSLIIGATSDNVASANDFVAYSISCSSGSNNWIQYINGTANGNDKCTGIMLSGGNVVAIGVTNNNSTGDDYSIIKFDESTGTPVFQVSYDYSSIDRPTSLVKDAQNNIAVVGVVYNSGNSEYEYHTNLFDSTGTLLWNHAKRVNSNSLNVEPTIAVDTIAWHFYVSGEIQNSNLDVLAYQLTPGGNIGWEKTFDAPFSSSDMATGIKVNGIGSVFLSAITTNSLGNYDITTIKIEQTPVYFPIDFNNANEPASPVYLYYKNQGQVPNDTGGTITDVEYYNLYSNPQYFVRKNSLSFLTRMANDSLGTDSIDRIDLNFVEANRHDFISAFEPQNDGYLNYFKPQVGGISGLTNLKGSKRLMVPEIYPGVDLHYYSTTSGVKLYFVVKPSYYPGSILMQWSPNCSPSLNLSNELSVLSSISNFGFETPKFYNVYGAVTGTTVSYTTTAVSGTLNNISGNLYGFLVGSYNVAAPLVIELQQKDAGLPNSTECSDWSTFFGGTGFEEAKKIAVDALGCFYVGGHTNSPGFPNSPGQWPSPVAHNGYDAFIAKFANSGVMMFGAFYGGASGSANAALPFGMAIEPGNQNIWLTGVTDCNTLPVTVSSNALQGSKDAFVVKFSANGTSVPFARYLGGNGDDQAKDIAFDGSGNYYIVGNTKSSSGLPITALTGAYNQSASSGNDDGFIARFNSSNSIDWLTLIGGGSPDELQSVKVLANGNVIISGITGNAANASANPLNPTCGVPLSASDFPNCIPTGGYTQNYGGGNSDNFILEFDNSGVMQWSTMYGGLGDEFSAKIVLDNINSNDFYLVGTTEIKNGPLSMGPAGSYIQDYPTSSIPLWQRGFIARFTNRMPVWHTLLGEGNETIVNDGVVDQNGNIYVSGKVKTTTYTYSSTCTPAVPATNYGFPKCLPSGAFSQPNFNGGTYDSFIMGFTSSFNLGWSTFFGGINDDECNSLAYKISDNTLFMTGNTDSQSNFPIFSVFNSLNYQQSTNALSLINSNGLGSVTRDAFITQLCLNTLPVGINEFHSKKTEKPDQIFPNPGAGIFNLSIGSSQNQTCAYEVFDCVGRMISQGSIQLENSKGELILPLNTPNGVYLLKVFDGSKNYSFKVIKE